MIVLREPDNKVLTLLPKADCGAVQKRSIFVIEAHVNGGSILYNTLTGEIVKLAEGEKADKELAEHRFTVPADTDEQALCSRVRGSLSFLREARFSGYRQYTILPTTDCNARCFYCYQRGCEHIAMSDADAEKTADFILKTRGKGQLNIRWFGGEPLYNSRAISIISRRLSEAEAGFDSDITTNGYLFDKALAQEAVSEWHLEKAQIALDGTRSVYNKRKAFIYKDPDAFETVMRSTENILNEGVKVRIRLNADNVNIEDLKELCVYLDERFRNHPGLTIYSHALFGIRLNNKDEKAIAERTLLFGRMKELDELISSLGRAGSNVPGSVKLFNCIADSPESIVIMPDGRTHACEQFGANHYLGTMDGGDLKSADLPYWRQVHPAHKDCSTCPLLPQCIKLKHCPDINEECLPGERELKIRKIQNALIKKYSAK